jgi:hypothetical protein
MALPAQRRRGIEKDRSFRFICQQPTHIYFALYPAAGREPAPLPNGGLVAVKTPARLPTAGEQQDAEPATLKKMVPNGATHLRLTTLPVVRA